MSRADVLRRIEEIGIVPVIRSPSADVAFRAVEAIVAGGIPICEITMTVPDAPALIRDLVGRLGDRALIGAGTVLDAAAATVCLDAGAAFLVGPGLDLDMVAVARKRDVPVMPGALTPTEVITAWRAGADMVKIFPVSAMGGASYLKALRAPLPQVKLLPTGGINVSNLADFVTAGAAAVGIGGELVDPAAIARGEAHVITDRARALRAEITRVRTSR
ncbi:MAG TPA: bifunctional 4-hydroxy-2-oxoglutarate aldolase/2-dehydro-3-deoxy-phosphogluconate aldolase [Polyangia bacterium]|nr:bifunctional 4-hydroxy-2-oxoglutarate aldolase/2-dehydro-3-deoxy-phosphogluconate aldolase [Polyangia bacterium]